VPTTATLSSIATEIPNWSSSVKSFGWIYFFGISSNSRQRSPGTKFT
jgi:hypothetical protein